MLSLSMTPIAHLEAARANRGAGNGEFKAQGSPISPDRAAAIARSATGGRVLDIRLQRGKRSRYRVKMLLDGKRVRSMDVDAFSGAILK
jgi:uncharacterized membrane protein YkoI